MVEAGLNGKGIFIVVSFLILCSGLISAEDAAIVVENNPHFLYPFLSSRNFDVVGLNLSAGLDEYVRHEVVGISTMGLIGYGDADLLRQKLEQYVAGGGILVVLSQRLGNEMSLIPGNPSGYGYAQDQGCIQNSVELDSYHPILASMTQTLLDINVDGYFTQWPDDAIVLLTRVKNAQPAMIGYPYGAGYVLITTHYEDWANLNYAGSNDGVILLRDMFYWAEAYAEKREDLTEHELGDSVPFSILINNDVNRTIAGIKVIVQGPDRQIVHQEWLNQTFLPNESFQYNYSVDASSYGFYKIKYSLYDAYDVVRKAKNADYFYVTHFTGENGSLSTDRDLHFTLNADSDEWFRYSSVPFTLTIVNNGDSDRLIDASYDLNHAHGVALGSFDVEAHSQTVIPFVVHDINGWGGGDGGRVWATLRENGQRIGYIWFGGTIIRPSIKIKVSSPTHEYYPLETLSYTARFENTLNKQLNTTSRIRLLNRFNQVVASEEFNHVFQPRQVRTVYFSYPLPYDALLGAYLIVADTYTDEGTRIGSGADYAYVRIANLGVDVTFPQVLDEENMISYKVTHLAGRNVSDANITMKAFGPQGQVFERQEQFGLDLGDFVVFDNEVLFDPLRFGTYAFTYDLLYGLEKRKGKLYKYNSVQPSMHYDRSFFRIRENVDARIDVLNDGQFYQDVYFTAEIPSVNYTLSGNFSQNPYETFSQVISAPIPETLAKGQYPLYLTLVQNNTRDFIYTFTIPPSKIRVTFDRTNFSIYEPIAFNVENPGGVDTTFSCYHVLFDPWLEVFGENSTNGSILAGEIQPHTADILGDAVDGQYHFYSECTDLSEAVTEEFWFDLDIDGLRINVTPGVALHYQLNESVKFNTSILNRDGFIHDANFILKIYPAREANVQQFRVPITLHADHVLSDEFHLNASANLTRRLEDVGVYSALNESSLDLVEVDGETGEILNYPEWQWQPRAGYDVETNAIINFDWYLEGGSFQGDMRTFHLLFDAEGYSAKSRQVKARKIKDILVR